MVSFTCPACDGDGKQSYMIFHGSQVDHKERDCQTCLGSGSMRERRDSPMEPEDWRGNR